jgi:hypothetical protein
MTAIGAATVALLVLPASPSPEPVGPRPDAERSVHHPDPVIERALAIVGQPLNPVTVAGAEDIRRLYSRALDAGPPEGLDAFRAPGDASDPRIYVNRDSPIYRRAARSPSALVVLQLAATLAHEQVHNTDREFAAARLQADFVRSRLDRLPRRERDAARRYLERLEGRARALARAEVLARVPPGHGRTP